MGKPSSQRRHLPTYHQEEEQLQQHHPSSPPITSSSYHYQYQHPLFFHQEHQHQQQIPTAIGVRRRFEEEEQEAGNRRSCLASSFREEEGKVQHHYQGSFLIHHCQGRGYQSDDEEEQEGQVGQEEEEEGEAQVYLPCDQRIYSHSHQKRENPIMGAAGSTHQSMNAHHRKRSGSSSSNIDHQQHDQHHHRQPSRSSSTSTTTTSATEPIEEILLSHHHEEEGGEVDRRRSASIMHSNDEGSTGGSSRRSPSIIHSNDEEGITTAAQHQPAALEGRSLLPQPTRIRPSPVVIPDDDDDEEEEEYEVIEEQKEGASPSGERCVCFHQQQQDGGASTKSSTSSGSGSRESPVEGGEGKGGEGEKGGEGMVAAAATEENVVFTPSYATYTPNSKYTHGLSYKCPEKRERGVLAPPSSVARPNIEDALKRVSVVIHKHITTCETRLKIASLRKARLQAEAALNKKKRGTGKSPRQISPTGSKEERGGGLASTLLSRWFGGSSSSIGSTPRQGTSSLYSVHRGSRSRGGRGRECSPIETDEEEEEEEAATRGGRRGRPELLSSDDESEEDDLFDQDDDDGFERRKMSLFREEEFVSPQYLYKFVRVPIARPGICYSMKKIKCTYHIPTLEEIYTFMRTLFKKASLSSECSIVCLIYIERLMEVAHVPLVAITWRPIVLCGLLLASKVWQDLSSWNVEFSNIYPQFSIQSINGLERLFINQLRWDLYISSSLYAKYYFALRSLYEKKDFRRRYNMFIQVHAPKADEISARTGVVAEDIRDMLSRSV